MLAKETRVSPSRKPRPASAANPRKQPSQVRSQETVQVILEAAARVLETKGLPGFNTNAVAERAGVSIGSLYQYFRNKDALMLALIERFEAELCEAIERSMAQRTGKSLPEALAMLVAALYEVHHRRAVLHRILEVEEERLRNLPHADNGQADLSPGLPHLLLELLQEHRAILRTPASLAAAEDLVTIGIGMVDVALLAGTPPAIAQRRILRALCGYLLWEPDDGS